MDRLLERSLEILSATSPPTLPMDRLSAALRRERMAVTESVLERSLAGRDHVRLIDPWLGANRAVSGIRGRAAGHRRWVCMTPARQEWSRSGRNQPSERSVSEASHTPREAPRLRLDRAIRALSDRIDLDSPVELARWVRICQEGTRANQMAA